jgi:hypothetical protein
LLTISISTMLTSKTFFRAKAHFPQARCQD